MSNTQATKRHEDISVSQEPKDKRLKVIRQDRRNVEDLECYIEIGTSRFRVVNLSPFGALIRTETPFEVGQFNCQLIVNNVDLGTLRLHTVRREANSSADAHLLAFEVDGAPIDIDRIDAIQAAQKVIQDNDRYQNSTRRIPDVFARKVYEIKDWLENLQMQINQLDRAKPTSESESYRSFEDTVVQVMGDYFNRVMPIKNHDLGEFLKDYNAEVIKSCYEFFREKLKDLIYQAPFSDRVFNKPLGYAGDYEMMNIIYRSAPEGQTLFAKCLHSYWVNQPAAQAVRNRANFLVNKITSVSRTLERPELSVLSVASGPAVEWQEILKMGELDKTQYRVDLLDQDENALKHAQRRLKELSGHSKVDVEFGYVHKAIKNILARGLDKKYDLIYSAGLFDYFSEPVAQIAAIKLFEGLKPGGQLVLGNFNVENPNSIVMDLALDWHLIYRSSADLIRMFECVGGKVEIETEPLNINLFCTIKKAK